MNYTYIIIDDDQESILETKAIAAEFSELIFVASANNYTDGLHLILEHSPKIIFIEIDPVDLESNLSLALLNDLHRYVSVIPKIIVTTCKKDLAFEAIQYQVTDYIIKPVKRLDLVQTLLKIKKTDSEDAYFLVPKSHHNQIQKTTIENNQLEYEQQSISVLDNPLILCIKSYGDHRYIDAKDICYLQADNNSTDIHLNNGEVVTAFKTLKHFEGVLSYPFIRIHNSYIINRNYISRIHAGNTVCFIKNTTTKLPFSRSYKASINLIISEFANGNYLEI